MYVVGRIESEMKTDFFDISYPLGQDNTFKESSIDKYKCQTNELQLVSIWVPRTVA